MASDEDREASIGDGSQAEGSNISSLDGAGLSLNDIDDASGEPNSQASGSYDTPLEVTSRSISCHVSGKELLLVVLILEDARHHGVHQGLKEKWSLLLGVSSAYRGDDASSFDPFALHSVDHAGSTIC